MGRTDLWTRVSSVISGNLHEVAQALGDKTETSACDWAEMLSGDRELSALEVMELGQALDVDPTWLMTGEADPLAVRFIARHGYDVARRQYTNSSMAADRSVLEDVLLAYRQASPWLEQVDSALPGDVQGAQKLLGSGSSRNFSDVVERSFGIDVLRLPGVETDYSFKFGSRSVVVLAARGNWFRTNFSLAHEVGHLCLGHPEDISKSHAAERAANNFAAELLMPARELRNIDFAGMSDGALARSLWDFGVSTEALKNRLENLGIALPMALRATRVPSTLSILRKNGEAIPIEMPSGSQFHIFDPIARRMQECSERRVPQALLLALVDGAVAGRVKTETIDWLLGAQGSTGMSGEPIDRDEVATADLMQLLC